MADEAALKSELVKDPANENGADAQRVLGPECPNCKTQLNVMAKVFVCLPFKFLVPFCGGCNHVLETILLDIAQPTRQIATPQRSPVIV